MKSIFYNRFPVTEVIKANAIQVFRKTESLDINTLAEVELPTEYLSGTSELSSEGEILFAMNPEGLKYDISMDTIILLYGEQRLGYGYITPINPAKYEIKSLKIDIKYEIKEEEEELEFIISISDNNPGIRVSEYSNSYSKVYSDSYLLSKINAKSRDFEEGSRQIAGHLMIGNERLDYLDRVREIHNIFLDIKAQHINTQQFRINQFKYYDFDLPKFNVIDQSTDNTRYTLSALGLYYILRDNHTGKDRMFLQSKQSIKDGYIIISNVPDVYWNYMESNEVTHWMYNQDEIAISNIHNGVKYAKYTDRVISWSDYIKGYLHCCNEDYVVIYNEGVYKLIHKDSGKIKEFDPSKWMFRMNNGRIYLVSLTAGDVYDHEFMQLVRTNALAYKSYNLVAINWYNGRIIAGFDPIIDENKIKFTKTYLIRGDQAYDLNVTTELYKVPTRLRHNNYEFMSDKVIIFPDTPIIATADHNYIAETAEGLAMMPFMNSLTQEGLGEDERMVVMRGMLLKISDKSINLY